MAIILQDYEKFNFISPSGDINLGSEDDLGFVRDNPLLRAFGCLEMVMKLLNDTSLPEAAQNDKDCLEATRCCLAFVKLEMKEYQEALDLAKLLLSDTTSTEGSDLHQQLQKRRLATASLYACEASCALGDTIGALKFLSQDDSSNNNVDRLAGDLAGVTTETAANSEAGKARLKKAQSMIRTSASVASANLGKLGAAKQLAMSAISLEDDRSLLPANADRSSARRALLYCMLREGNRDGALAVLRSSR